MFSAVMATGFWASKKLAKNAIFGFYCTCDDDGCCLLLLLPLPPLASLLPCKSFANNSLAPPFPPPQTNPLLCTVWYRAVCESRVCVFFFALVSCFSQKHFSRSLPVLATVKICLFFSRQSQIPAKFIPSTQTCARHVISQKVCKKNKLNTSLEGDMGGDIRSLKKSLFCQDCTAHYFPRKRKGIISQSTKLE